MKLRTKQMLSKIGMASIALCWGVSFVVTKDTLDVMQPNTLLVFRYLISALAIALVCGKKLKHTTRAEVLAGCGVGVTAYFGMLLQTDGLNYTTPGKSAFLTASYCVLVPFIAWVWTRKRPAAKHFVAAALCLCGIGLIALSQGFSIGVGDAMTIGCAVVFAANFVMIDRWFAPLNVLRVTMYQLLSTAVMAFIAMLIAHEAPPVITWQSAGSLAYLALLATAASMLIQNIAQRFIDSSTTALLCSLESVFAVFASILLTHEQISLRVAIGFVLVFSAVVTAELDFSMLRRGKTHDALEEKA